MVGDGGDGAVVVGCAVPQLPAGAVLRFPEHNDGKRDDDACR